MKQNILTADDNYGLIQKDHDYLMLDEDIDWYLIKIRGFSMYAFKWVFEDNK